MPKLIYHHKVFDEIDDAERWHAARAPFAVVALLTEIERGLSMRGQHPLRWPRDDDNCRYFPLKRFPFRIIYSVESDHLFIAALAHHKRRPGYWKRRLRRRRS